MTDELCEQRVGEAAVEPPPGHELERVGQRLIRDEGAANGIGGEEGGDTSGLGQMALDPLGPTLRAGRHESMLGARGP
jgi:hypothetical protein